jgi:hypothetical protein
MEDPNLNPGSTAALLRWTAKQTFTHVLGRESFVHKISELLQKQVNIE